MSGPEHEDHIRDTCPLCAKSAKSAAVWVSRSEFDFVRCTCGLIYKSRDAEDKRPKVALSETYFTKQTRASKASYTQRRWRRVQKSRYQILDMLEFTEPGPLLDIGCSLGYTLEAAEQLGLRATGLDLSEHAIEQCRNNGFNAITGSIDARLPFDDASFQLIVLKHVFEHTSRPRALLHELHRLLRPGGIIFLAVPHAGYRRAAKNPADHHFYWPGRAGSEHDVYYTPATMTAMLEACDFSVHRMHPMIFHGRIGWPARCLELLFIPGRLLRHAILNILKARREFWAVAGR